MSADSPQGRFEDGAGVLDGRVLGATDAWGKHLFHRYDDLWLHVHLGLYGKFAEGALPAPEPRGALRLRLEGAGQYLDLRGATRCEVVTPAEKAEIVAGLAAGGIQPTRTNASRAVSDAMRAEVARGRIARIGWGRYVARRVSAGHLRYARRCVREALAAPRAA